jgi:DNA-binding MarR family transcriptional regulator
MDEKETAINERLRAAYWQAVRGTDVLRLRQWERWHITLPQLRVLHQVRRSPGITTGDIARSLGITVSTTSGLISKLADRGLVERLSQPGDRRQIPLRLTADGEALLGEMRGPSSAFLDEVIRQLGPERERVTEALEILARATAAARDALPTDEEEEPAPAGAHA